MLILLIPIFASILSANIDNQDNNNIDFLYHTALYQSDIDSLASSDSWTSFDKLQHFTFSFLWVLSTQYILVDKFEIKENDAIPLSITSSALIGISKEIYDARSGRYISKKDLIANTIGILAATIILMY